MQYRLSTAMAFVLATLSSPLAAQSETKTYEYDALGRLIKVEVDRGSQDTEQRDYTYDEADNRTQVVSSVTSPPGTPTPSPTPTPTPVTCLLGPEDFTTTASGAAYPRVRTQNNTPCGFDISLTYSISEQSGSGVYTHWIGNGGVLNAADSLRTMGIDPDETTISGSPLVLHVNWSTSTPGAAIDAPGYSVVTINPEAGSGPSCELGPEDFTTTASGAAYPRVRTPGNVPCGFDITLAYTITVQSGGPVQYTDWIGNGGVLNGTDSLRTMGIDPDETTFPANPVVLRVNWSVVSGNATIASPGYSEVTINPD